MQVHTFSLMAWFYCFPPSQPLAYFAQHSFF